MPISHSLQYYALICFAELMRLLPRRAALFFGGCLGQIGWLTGLKRSLVLSNIKQALPQATEKDRRRIAARSARNFARTITEFVRCDGKDRQNVHDLVSIDGLDLLREAIKAGNGAILITAHLGAWALYFSAISNAGIPISLLVGKQRNKRVDDFIHRIPPPNDILIPKGRSAVKKILHSLNQGRCIVMVADQHAGSQGIMSDFLGRAAPTLSLPGAFFARNRPPVFTMAGNRVLDGRHQVTIRPLAFDETLEKEALKQAVTDKFNQALGEAVIACPDQYFWYHRRWRDSDADIIAK
jgi:KDO2-lipid IV(A) lauroyltransferase